MAMLKVLAIVMASIGGLCRLVALIAPEVQRKVLKFFLQKRAVALGLFVVVAILGGLFIWGARIYLMENDAAAWAAYVLLALGVVLTVMGLLWLIAPRWPFTIMANLFVAQESTLRMVAAAGLLACLIVIWVALNLQ